MPVRSATTLVLTVLTLVAGAAQAAEVKLSLSPAVAFFSGKPGETARQEFVLTNQSAEPLRLALERTDVWYDAKGQRTFPAPGSLPRGLGGWLSEPPAHLDLPAHGRARFVSMVPIPLDAAGGTYVGAYVARVLSADASANARPGQREASSRIVTRIAMLVSIDVAGADGRVPAPVLTIADASAVPPGVATPLKVRVQLHNPSITATRPAGTVALFGADGQPFGKAAFPAVAVWPGQSQWVEATFPMELDPGAYRGIVAFEAPNTGLVSHVVPFTVPAAKAAAR